MNEQKQSAALIESKELRWENAGEGMKRQIVGYDEHLMLVKVAFETGAVGAVHRHPHTQTSYIVSGRFEVTVGGETKILGAGDGFHMAPNQEHGCKCLEAGMVVDVFTPMREDFLK